MNSFTPQIFTSPLFLDSVVFAEIFASHMNEVWELALVEELMKSRKIKRSKGRGAGEEECRLMKWDRSLAAGPGKPCEEIAGSCVRGRGWAF